MGIGREVADAYIDVHGDLKSFRKDLEKARPEGEQFGEDFMTEFGKGMEDRGKRDMAKRWNSVMDAIHQSGDKFDFGRMIEAFDPSSMDNALDKIRNFTEELYGAGKMTRDEWLSANNAIEGQAASIREVQDERQRLNDMMTEAIADNKAYDRSFQGITRSIKEADLEGDFRKIAEAMAHGDISKWAKGFDSFDELRDRVASVTDSMVDLGRMTDEDSLKAREFAQEFIRGQEDAAAALAATKEQARLAKEQQEKYKKSLDGMVEAHHFRKIESDFNDLTAAIGTADWSKFAKGADDLQDFRDNVIRSAAEMRHFGKITGEEFDDIIAHLDKVSQDLEGHKVHLEDNDRQTRDWGISMGDVRDKARALAGHMAGTFSHAKGLAGLNVFGDILDDGLNIARNIDRVALSIGTASLKMGSAASILLSAGGGLVNIIGDLGSALNIGWLAPGFLTAAGIQIGVLVAAFKDMKTKLADLKPQFAALQDNISEKFWAQAEAPIRRLVDSLMPTLQTQLGNTATELGGLFKAFTDGFTKNATPARVEGMFRKMNGAIKTAQGAMEPLTSAFVTLGEHASDYFGRFADWIVKLSTQFDDFVTAAAKDGRLKQWTEDAIQAFKDTGRAIGGVVEIFQGLNQAAEAAGLGGLTAFADTLERMADIAKSPDFQKGLTPWLEGAKASTDAIIGAINDRLFPALGNIAPTMSGVLSNIGNSVATLIGYAADIIENPNLQAGLKAMTDGLKTAVDTLQPAIKPMGDSLGNLLTISGHIVENISKLVTTFTVELSPVIDDMGRKFETLADPLTNSVQNAITTLKPVFQTLSTEVVGPVVAGINEKLLPAIDQFVRDAGPVLDKIIKDVGPILKTLVTETLPNAVNFAGQLLPIVQGLADVLTPAFGTALKEVGDGFKNAAEGLKALRGEANNFDWKFGGTDPRKNLLESWGKSSSNTFWEDLGNVLFGGSLVDMGQRMLEAWKDDFDRMFSDLGKTIADGWQRVFSGNIFGDQPGKFFREIGDFFTKGGVDKFDDSVNQWFEDNLVNPIKNGWDDAWNGLKGWYEDVKQGFQDFMSGLLGFNTSPGDEASIGGSVAGGKGRSVGGKITPEMLGVGAPDDNWLQGTIDKVKLGIQDLFNQGVSAITDFGAMFVEGWNAFWTNLPQSINDVWTGVTTTLQTWWTNITTGLGTWLAGLGDGWNSFWAGFGTGISEIWTNITTFLQTAWTNITTSLGTWLAGLGEGWNSFWSGFGTGIAEIWTNITTFLQTAWTNITTGITTWFGQLKAGWDTFWAQLPVTVQTIWTNITTWISTSIGTIISSISNFIGQVSANWNNFWTGVFTKVQQIWTQVTQWIQTQVGAIQSNIASFISTVTGSWNSFWTTVWTKVSSTWSQITSWISSQVGAIIGSIVSFGGQVISNWNSTWSNVQSFVQSAWQNIVTAVSGGVSNVMGFISSLPGQISGALSGLGGLLLGAGASIMDGFLKGLQGAWGAVQDFVGGIASWIAENKGPISYDRTLLTPAGQAIMSGLVEGLKDGMAPLRATINTVTETLQNSITDAVSHSKMYSAGVDAALGLADGLKSQGSTLESTFAGLMPSLQASVDATTSGFGQALAADAPPAQAGNTVIFEKEAILVDSKASNNKIVASTVIDSINDIFDS